MRVFLSTDGEEREIEVPTKLSRAHLIGRHGVSPTAQTIIRVRDGDGVRMTETRLDQQAVDTVEGSTILVIE